MSALNVAVAEARAALAALPASPKKTELAKRLGGMADKVDAINKATQPSVEDIKMALDAMSPEERAHVMTKAALALPKTMRI